MRSTIKTLVLSVFLLSISFSQVHAQDYFINTNGKQIDCDHLSIKSYEIFYQKKGKKKMNSTPLTKVRAVSISDSSLISNPLGVSVEEPHKGFAYVYFMNPTANLDGAVSDIHYNGDSLTTVCKGSYFLHKIELNQEHNYIIPFTKTHTKRGYFFKARLLNDYSTKLRLNPKKEEVYFIRLVAEYFTPDESVSTTYSGGSQGATYSRELRNEVIFMNSKIGYLFLSNSTHYSQDCE